LGKKIYPNLSQIGGNYLSIIFSQSFVNWSKNSPNNCQIIATDFYIHKNFATIWQFWGKNVPPLMNKIFNIKYFTAE
jgi:tRNA U34 5-methylaminomethyl-2-thiouridine-forming methyltransferase MnmC